MRLHPTPPYEDSPSRTLSGYDDTQRRHHVHNCCPEDSGYPSWDSSGALYVLV